MNQDPKEKPNDPLALNGIYPEPKDAFLHQPKPLAEIKETCLIFLDTNVLLLPYNTGKDSLASIGSVYKSLAKNERLLLPERVMQEFETNVPEQLKRVFHAISVTQNLTAPTIDFPLLEETKEYQSLKSLARELAEKISEYRKVARGTLSIIENWSHNDPVRQMYREIFKDAPSASITSLNGEKLLLEWERRLKQKIPPGYKDGGKEDSGIGDFLVWQAILDTCAMQKKDAILVSGEEKPDWWHSSNQQTLYPRRELVEEFRRATGGKTIHLLKPSRFFELFGASKETVQEIATEQTIVRKRLSFNRMAVPTAYIYRAVGTWLKNIVSVGGIYSLENTSPTDYLLITENRIFKVEIKSFSTIQQFRGVINSLEISLSNNLEAYDGKPVIILASHDKSLVTGAALEYLSRARIPESVVVLTGLVDSDESFWPIFRSDVNWPY